MLNLNVIDQKHVTSLQASLLKNHSVVDEPIVNQLYRTAQALMKDPASIVVASTISTSLSEAKDRTVTCTDEKTGLFIQLTGQKGKSQTVIFGKKYCQEYIDGRNGGIATKMW